MRNKFNRPIGKNHHPWFEPQSLLKADPNPGIPDGDWLFEKCLLQALGKSFRGTISPPPDQNFNPDAKDLGN